MFKLNLPLLLLVVLIITNNVKAESFTGLHKDIPIGVLGDTRLSINIAFPSNSSNTARPVVLFIHGGGYVSGSKDAKNRQLRKFAEMGYVAASAMYRLAPAFRFPSQIEDIKLAIRYLKANATRYGVDPTKIILVGASAGSYLAVMAGVTGNSDAFSDNGLYSQQDASVRAVVAQSPPIANFTLPKYRNSLTLQRLMDPNTTDINATLERMSPVTYLDNEDPPFFISHGSDDPLVSVDMSREFVSALESINHEFVYHEVEGGTHSLSQSTPQEAKIVFSELLRFIEKWSEKM